MFTSTTISTSLIHRRQQAAGSPYHCFLAKFGDFPEKGGDPGNSSLSLLPCNHPVGGEKRGGLQLSYQAGLISSKRSDKEGLYSDRSFFFSTLNNPSIIHLMAWMHDEDMCICSCMTDLYHQQVNTVQTIFIFTQNRKTPR